MDAYDYPLPPEAVAQEPAEPRDSARLLAALGGPEPEPEHRRITDLPDLLEAGDLLVVNDTRVLPARLHLHKTTGGAAEVLLLEPAPTTRAPSGRRWSAPAAACRPGTTLLGEGGIPVAEWASPWAGPTTAAAWSACWPTPQSTASSRCRRTSPAARRPRALPDRLRRPPRLGGGADRRACT